MKEIEEIQAEIIKIGLNKLDKNLEYILRYMVEPPIKGEITKGKIKWRGLVLVHDYWHNAIHVKQRGKLISTIKTDFGKQNKY